MMSINNTFSKSESVEILYIVKRTREINKLLAIQENRGKIELIQEMNALKSRSAAIIKSLEERKELQDEQENNDSGKQEEDLQTERKCKFMGFFGFLKKKNST